MAHSPLWILNIIYTAGRKAGEGSLATGYMWEAEMITKIGPFGPVDTLPTFILKDLPPADSSTLAALSPRGMCRGFHLFPAAMR